MGAFIYLVSLIHHDPSILLIKKPGCETPKIFIFWCGFSNGLSERFAFFWRPRKSWTSAFWRSYVRWPWIGGLPRRATKSKIIMSKLGGGADIYSRENERMSPENQWLEDLFNLLKLSLFTDILVFRGVPQMCFFLVPWQLWFFDVLRFEADESILNLTANLTANFKHQFCEDHFPHAASAHFRLRYIRTLWSSI